jgi:hypothetical protein
MLEVKIVLALVLVLLIVFDFKFPGVVTDFANSAPGLILVLGLVLYLFTQGPLLGVLAVILGFMLTRQTTMRAAARVPEPLPEDKGPSFGVTLEETMVRNILPLVNNSPNAAFVASLEKNNNAASVL